MSGEVVLVTGGTGFIATHCIVQLLHAGYRVRTTVRSLDRAGEVREMVRRGEADPDRIEFVVADLGRDDGWTEAVAGATYVLHVASPFPMRQPKDENELIEPARDGVLRVLRAARAAGVRRVVLTSSFAAIGYRADPGRPFVEKDWTDLVAAAPHAVHQVEDHRRARRMGLRRPRGRRPRAGGGESGAASSARPSARRSRRRSRSCSACSTAAPPPFRRAPPRGSTRATSPTCTCGR